MTTVIPYRKQLQQEVDALPEEYLPYILQIVQTFRESVMLKPASASVQQGWHEAQTGVMTPVDELWDDIDAE
ncbi:MAG: hypothetical protein AB4911_25535 [Oscillochloridaceae bacterium umkhey_bin13]